MKKLGFDLILLGDPAAGKDTQAAILKQRYKLTSVETGKYWRSIGKKKNLSRLIQQRQNLSLPTPVKIINAYIAKCVSKAKKGQDLIFIGAARLKPEAQHLVKLLKRKQRDFFVLYIKIPKSEIIARSFKRGQRAEDRDRRLINNRLKYFKNQVSKTVGYYRQMKKLKFIAGNQSITAVTKDIEKAIHDYQNS